MISSSKSRHTYHRKSVSIPLLSRHRLCSLSYVGMGLGFFCHSKSNSKKVYLIWFTVICYMVGAYVAYSIYFDGGTGRRGKEQLRLIRSDGETKTEFSTFPAEDRLQFNGNQDRKKILFWTEFYKEYSLDSLCIRPETLTTCPFTQCDFTLDKTHLTSSDAVIFHGRDLWGSKKLDGYTDSYIDLPKFRSENQLWIFLMFEAPVHTWINLEPFDNLFNMTMTYRQDSDIYIPYGRVRPIQKTRTGADNGQENHFLTLTTASITAAGNNQYSTKPLTSKRLVAWSVSNCYKTPSRRNEVVHELHKYIPIDIYGDCGSLNCTPKKDLCDSGLECHRFLADKYKFYLAFENSLCEDYITEKFYDSLYVGMVPVVYGYGDYSRVAPKGSYIDARVFPTMKSLANYLLYLDQHPLEYLKYFKWRNNYEIKVSYFQQAWCSLCTKLWTNGNIDGNIHTGSYIVHNLSDWWFHKSSSGSSSAIISSGSGRGRKFTETDTGRGTETETKAKTEAETVHLKENACLNPTQLKWDLNIFSFYGFIYYPNHSVKMVIIYAMLVFGVIFGVYLVKSASVGKRMLKTY